MASDSKRHIPRHGDGRYVVFEANPVSGEEAFVVYGDTGRLAPDVARFDPNSWTVELNLSTLTQQSGNIAQPVMPYRRYFGHAHRHETPSLDDLRLLGDAMQFNDFEDQVGDIPAAYTYLGQFVFHDCSYMQPGDSVLKPANKRTAALDLDSIFDLDPHHPPVAQCPVSTGPMPVGCTAEQLPLDLPRASGGEPVIGDLRNDDNLPLAQTHMALLRFFNAVSTVAQDEARDMASLHFQSIVLHDYLERIICPDVYCDVLENGRAIIEPSSENAGRQSVYLLPLEFAAACGRFGHSMIRNHYDWNRYHPGAKLQAFFDNTFGSSAYPIERLPDRWYARWQRLLGIDLGPGESAIMAARIGTRFAWQLKTMPPEALPVPTEPGCPPFSSNLATRSLERGHMLELNSGQAVAQHANATLQAAGRPTFDILSSAELLADESPDVQGIMTRCGIVTATPLWFYTLKEAAVRSDGKKLGPLGSRIVMEALHAAIERANPTILPPTPAPAWRPDQRLRPASPTKYTFADLIRFAQLIMND